MPSDESPYLLNDPAAEAKYGFNLNESLERAKQLKAKGGLLKDMHFYVVSV
jgi:hypothetical protein